MNVAVKDLLIYIAEGDQLVAVTLDHNLNAASIYIIYIYIRIASSIGHPQCLEAFLIDPSKVYRLTRSMWLQFVKSCRESH